MSEKDGQAISRPMSPYRYVGIHVLPPRRRHVPSLVRYMCLADDRRPHARKSHRYILVETKRESGRGMSN